MFNSAMLTKVTSTYKEASYTKEMLSEKPR